MIVIMGGTGLMGQAVVKRCVAENREVTVVTRNVADAEKVFDAANSIRFVEYQAESLKNTINSAEAVINLVGDNIAHGRWTKEKKRKIIESRIKSVETLESAIKLVEIKPKVVIQASATGIYGDREDETCTEDTEPGAGFLAKVCSSWEQKNIDFASIGIHHKTVRFGVVLTPDGGFLKKMLPMFKLWVGAVIGNGQDYIPWIHIDDLVSAIMFLIENPEIAGTFNVTSPNPAKSIIFNRTLGKVLHRPVLFRIPGFILKIFMGQVAKELILSSQKVHPVKLIDAGFQFTHPNLEEALHDLLSKK